MVRSLTHHLEWIQSLQEDIVCYMQILCVCVYIYIKGLEHLQILVPSLVGSAQGMCLRVYVFEGVYRFL